jgi:hypothetical protein
VRLARRHLDFSLPLGSRPVSPKESSFADTPLHRIEKLIRFSAAVKNARARRQPCAKAVANHAIRSAVYAADRAKFYRLAAKAEPDHLGRGLPLVQAAIPAAAPHEHLARLHRFLASTSPAKAPDMEGVEAAAMRIARVSSTL